MKRRHFLSLSVLGAIALQPNQASARPTSYAQWQGFYQVRSDSLTLKAEQVLECVESLTALTKSPVYATGNTLTFAHLGRNHTLQLHLVS